MASHKLTKDASKTGKPKEPLPEIIQQRYDEWRSIFMTNTRINWIIATTSIIASSLAASKLFIDFQTVNAGLSWIAAAGTALVAFYNFKENASAFKAAWRILDRKVFLYDLNPNDETKKALYEAVDEGEAIIKSVDK